MDSSFWNKLKKTIMTAPKGEPSSAMQLSRFNKCWTTVQNGFSTQEKRNLHIQQTEIPMRLKNMVDLLVDEESRLDDATGTTGVCMEYLLKNNVLAKLVNNSEADQPRGIMGETIRTIAGMINLLDDRFLVHNAVHKPTVKLLRTCASGSEPQGESYHEDLVDLMYILCSKIHGYPELLNIFFHDKQWLTVPQRVAAKRLQKNRETMELLKNLRNSPSETTLQDTASPSTTALPEESSAQEHETTSASSPTSGLASPAQQSESGSLPKSDYEFLLFTYLSKFVHREGKAGDFARTGLLFLMELATGSLGEYILDTEFTSFLSAGVGALYSQLPRKLLVRGGPSTINSMVGTLNDRASPAEATPSRRANIELSTSTDFQSRLDAFLKLLEFCQDIMMRCPNREIVAALLTTFKSVFLENILYPSILECSDTDGSSVAVISYIDLILQVLEHEALVDLVVGFLMASEDDDSRAKIPEDMDAFAEVQNPHTTSPYFMATGRFTLKDLVLSRLKSRSQPTVIATLKLLNTVITRHCKYSLKLLSIQPDSNATSFRDQPDLSNTLHGDRPMISHHVHELDLFYALISTINPHNTADIFCNGYESYLRDAEGSVEMHQCFVRSREIENQTTPGQLSALERKKQRRRSMKYGHRMDLPEDLSGDSFMRDQEKNAEALAALSCCDKAGSHPVPMHRLLPSDPLLQILLGTLSHFFAHSVELNLALTGVITSLAVCPYRSLEGWLLFKSSDAKKPEEDRGSEDRDSLTEVQQGPDPALGDAQYDSDDEESLPFYLTRSNVKAGAAGARAAVQGDEASVPAFKSFPPFFTMLKTLTQQVDYYRSEIDGFDEYLADRRRGLLVATELNSAIHTPGLAGETSHPHHHPHPSTFSSSDAFVDPVGGARPSTPTMMTGSSSSLAGSTSPRFTGGVGSRVTSPAPQRINTNVSPAPGAGPIPNPASLKIASPRARKSSSPSSLMSTPSNMSFLVPPGMGKKPFKGSSGSPLAGGSSLTWTASEAESGHLLPAPVPVVAPSATRPLVGAGGSGASRPAVVGGMAGTGHVGAGGSASSSTGLGMGHGGAVSFGSQYHHHQHTPSQGGSGNWGSFGANPVLKTMDTMMIKPLFPDGFVNDSDSEAETGLDIEAEFSDDDDQEEGASQESSSSSPRPTAVGPRKVRRVREGSSSDAAPVSEAGAQHKQQAQQAQQPQDKLVTLSQLLTNVVILEEVVKEVVAVAQVRRGLGVDKVRFL